VRLARTPGRPLLRHPAQVIVTGFGGAVLLGTLLLMLPLASSRPGGAPFVTALFTSVSAVCVTGLVTVDTASYWSGAGEAIILVLIQVGGFGIMALASLVGLLLSRRMGLRTRLTAAAETKSLGLGDVRAVLFGVAKVSLVFEAITALVLTLRFAFGYDEPFGRAAYLGVFHAVSAFNNAGFALWSDSLTQFVTDPWICLPIAFAVIVGGLGFPVILELRRQLGRPRRWSLHTKLTVWTSVALLALGTVFVTASEWNNPGTLGALSTPGRLLAGFFHAVMPAPPGSTPSTTARWRRAHCWAPSSSCSSVVGPLAPPAASRSPRSSCCSSSSTPRSAASNTSTLPTGRSANACNGRRSPSHCCPSGSS
jgi:trk system potassium uptake protein TrkH